MPRRQLRSGYRGRGAAGRDVPMTCWQPMMMTMAKANIEGRVVEQEKGEQQKKDQDSPGTRTWQSLIWHRLFGGVCVCAEWGCCVCVCVI